MMVAVLGEGAVERPGPASQGFESSLRHALSAAMAVWQLVVLMAVLVADTRFSAPLLVAAHVAAMVLCLLVMVDRLPLLPVLLGLYGLWFLDYLACTDLDSALLLAACWLGNMIYAAAAVLLHRWLAIAVPVGGAIAVGTGLVLLYPSWPIDLSTAFVVTAVAIVVAAQLAMPFLRRLAVQADLETDRAAEDARQREASRRASREAAEDARIVHDTVVNTLGAVADGVRVGLSPTDVRERCRADAERISQLLAGRRDDELPSIDDIEREDWGLTFQRAGMVDDELQRQESLVGPEALRALYGAVRELVRNVAKHAGVDRVVLTVDRRDDQLEVSVEDEGSGFVPGAVAERGLDLSVRARLDAVGGAVEIASAPGQGTHVRLSVPLATARSGVTEVASGSTTAGATVDALRQRAAWMWTCSALAVGFVIEFLNRPGQLTATYVMLLLVVACALLVRSRTRGGRRLPTWVGVTLAVAVVPAFLAAMAGVDFGRTDVVYYQAIGFTPLLVLLTTFRGVAALRSALLLLAATAAVMAGLLWPSDRDAAVTVLVGLAPALGMGVGWLGFSRLLADLVLKAEQERASSAAARTEVAARSEIAAARRRWRAAGLTSSLALLQGIADGRLEPGSTTVRNRCAQEEAYLRQMIQLSPEAYRMSAWFARALAEARLRDVRFVVRGSEVDAPDDEVASDLGALVVSAVAAATPGGQVVAGLFTAHDEPRLVVVGDAGRLRPLVDTLEPSRWRHSCTTLSDQDVLEVSALTVKSELVPSSPRTNQTWKAE